jgi:AraC-like DNA-binding protein
LKFSSHPDTKIPPSRPCLEHLLEISREELTWLASILRESRCGVVLRGGDGSVLSVIAAGETNDSNVDEQCTVSAPIFDPKGRPLVFLDIIPRDANHLRLSPRLLRGIVRSVAQTIAERWFRICYRSHWIVAARCANDPDNCVLLAVAHDYRIVGADYGSRQLLQARGMDLKQGLGLSAFFRFYPADLGRSFESSMKLPATVDGLPWWVLITSPDISAGALIHSRPRMRTIPSLSRRSAQKRESFGLPLHMRRRIEEFIDARLESGVELAELARSIGFSLSHFSRMFRKSYGVPPHRYLMRRRLSLARDLLIKTELRLATIALKSGFADRSHLSRNFRRCMGLSPRAFRIQHPVN